MLEILIPCAKITFLERNCRLWILLLQTNRLTLASKEGERWWLNNLIEESSSPDEQRETNDLKPLKSLPAESQTYKPDE